MSTAGKVLVVLILLATVGWIFLGAGVAQLNRNGNAALAKLQHDLETAEQGLYQAQLDLVKLKDETSRFQSNMNTEIAVIRTRLGNVEVDGTRLTAVLNHLQAQLQTVETTVASAQHDLEIRRQEKAEEIQLLADARAGVRELQDQDAELTERLASLRNQFKETFQSNVQKVSAASADR